MKKYTYLQIIAIVGFLTSCDLTDPVAGLEYDDAYYSKQDKINPHVTEGATASNSPFGESSATSSESDYVADYYDSNYIANLNRKFSQESAYQYADPASNSSSLWNPTSNVSFSTGMMMGYGYSSFGVQTGFGNNSFYDPYGYDPFYSPWYPYGSNYSYSPHTYYSPYTNYYGGYYAVPIQQTPVYRPTPRPSISDKPSYATNPRDESKPNPYQYSSPRQKQRVDRSSKNWDFNSPSYSQPEQRSSQNSYSSPGRSTYSSPSRSSSTSRSSSPRSARSRGGSPR